MELKSKLEWLVYLFNQVSIGFKENCFEIRASGTSVIVNIDIVMRLIIDDDHYIRSCGFVVERKKMDLLYDVLLWRFEYAHYEWIDDDG